MDPLTASLAASPELFPLSFEATTDQTTLIRLTEAGYRQASFLDERIVAPQTPRRTVQWPELDSAVAASGLAEAANYIFHIGHVGSTLLSRLLGEHPEVFALREPAILRSFARACLAPAAPAIGWSKAEFDARLGTLLRLLSRTFRPEQRAIIKATSFVSELAGQILNRPSGARALLVFVPAETYLATILGAPNSPVEARTLAESRLNRLHGRMGEKRWHLAHLSEGEMVAMSWACEMSALAAAAEAAEGRALWMNFDSFLEDPAAALGSAFAHLGIEAAAAQIRCILSGPDMRRYAKAPEYAYNAELRRDLLNQARRTHTARIEQGMQWLLEAKTVSPIFSQVLKIADS